MLNVKIVPRPYPRAYSCTKLSTLYSDR